MLPIEQSQDQKTRDQSLRHRRLWIGRAGCLVGMAVGVIGLLFARMSHLWVAFDVFAQFTVQFALLAAAFAIGLLLPRAKVASALILFGAMLAAYGGWPFLAQDDVLAARASATTEGSLKVMSFNTWLVNSSPSEVEQEIRRVDADVVTLVEFGTDKQPMLASLRASYPYQADCAGANHCAFAILSKFPISTTSLQTIWEGPPYMHVVLGGKMAGLNVYAVHTTRFPHSRAQFHQMKAFSSLLQQTAGAKLVMGDFNATPYSRMTSILEQEVDLQRFTSLPSWPAYLGLPQLAIDHIFATQGIVAVDAPRLGKSSGSDHFPVSMTLQVPAQALSVN